MTRRPPDPRPYRAPTEPTWTGIAAATALVVAVPLGLWAAANPLAGAAVLAAGAAAVHGGRLAVRARRCLADCGGFTVDLTDDLRLRVVRDGAAETC